MAKRREVLGEVFGLLTVIKFIRKDKNGEEIYLCKCSCGKERECRKSALLYENMKNCGCLNKKTGQKVKDLTGQRFGRWTVLERGENIGRATAWKCKCDCGTIKNVNGNSLKQGGTLSCGCLAVDASYKHGMYKSRLNKEYRGIKQRCYNPKNTRYEYYGGRGIKICDEWLGKEGFANFMNWSLENGYNDKLTLDRIEVDKSYSPSNCRWVDMKVQARNRRISPRNKTGISGVFLRTDRQLPKYRVGILDNEGKKINLGQYETLEEAKEVRKQAELKYWGFTNIKD